MKCCNCMYYRASAVSNECRAFGWDNFRTPGECNLVDDQFNIIKDDTGRLLPEDEIITKNLMLKITKERGY